MYEGGVRVPLIVRWPGAVKPGSTCDTPVISMDLFPTITEIIGAPGIAKTAVDGVSLVPLLRQTGDLKRDELFWHYPHYGNQGGTPGAAVSRMATVSLDVRSASASASSARSRWSAT